MANSSPFDGKYTSTGSFPDGWTHTENDQVTGLSAEGTHTFTNPSHDPGFVGSFTWTAQLSPTSNPNVDELSGSGVIHNNGVRDFTLTGEVHLNANGTATLFWNGTDTKFGPIGSTTQAKLVFTQGDNGVVFSSLTPDQQDAINGGAQIYNALGGNDTVTLPDQNTNYSLSPGVNATWDINQTFVVGALNDSPTNSDTIAGHGAYNIDVSGPAKVNITITGDGNSNIAAGTGADSITINANGNNSITAGAGSDTVSITGTGSSTIAVGTGSENLSIAGGGSLDVTGAFNGSVSIGAIPL
jgi:hypothetical protein